MLFASADAEEALLSDELSDALLSLELSELLSELLPEAAVLLLLLKNEATNHRAGRIVLVEPVALRRC